MQEVAIGTGGQPASAPSSFVASGPNTAGTPAEGPQTGVRPAVTPTVASAAPPAPTLASYPPVPPEVLADLDPGMALTWMLHAQGCSIHSALAELLSHCGVEPAANAAPMADLEQRELGPLQSTLCTLCKSRDSGVLSSYASFRAFTRPAHSDCRTVY